MILHMGKEQRKASKRNETEVTSMVMLNILPVYSFMTNEISVRLHLKLSA